MKKLVSLVLSSVLVLSFGACERKQAESPDDTEQVRTQKKEIVFYNLFDPEDTLKGQIQAFQSTYKDVKITYKKFHNIDEYQALLLNELAEGRGPDIFAIRNDWISSYQGKLFPAPNSLYVPEKFSDIFLPIVNEDLILPDEQGNDRIWGVSLFVDTLALYYNKQLFRDFLPSTNKPAETWTALKEQVFGLTKTDNSIERFSLSGIALGYAANILHFPDILSLLLIQQEASLYDAEQKRALFSKAKGVNPSTGQQSFPVLESLKLYTGFALPSSRHFSWNLPLTGLYTDQKELGAFARGKTAMMFGFSSTYDQVKVIIDGFARANKYSIQVEDIGIAPVPQFSATAESGKREAFAKYYPLVVSRNSQYPEESWQLLEFLTSPESLALYHEKTKKPTSRLDMVEEQSIEKFFGIFALQAAYAKSLQTLDPGSFFAIFADINDNIVKNRISPEEGVKIAERRMNCILAKRSKPELDENCFDL